MTSAGEWKTMTPAEMKGGVSSLFQFPQDWAVCTSSRYMLQMAIERRGWPCPLAGRLCSLGAAVCQSAWEKIWLLVIPWADTWDSCPPSYPFSFPQHHVCGRGEVKGENLREMWEVSGIIWKYEVFSKINPSCQEGGGRLDRSLNYRSILFLCKIIETRGIKLC